MIQPDTIRLLRECDAGIQMGVSSINDVLYRVKSPHLKQILTRSKAEHHSLDTEVKQLLDQYKDDGKEPNFFAEKMAKMKTELKLQMNDTDSTVAELMTDGCSMGVKSLNQYLNRYTAADERSKNIAKRLIDIEDRLSLDLRRYL